MTKIKISDIVTIEVNLPEEMTYEEFMSISSTVCKAKPKPVFPFGEMMEIITKDLQKGNLKVKVSEEEPKEEKKEKSKRGRKAKYGPQLIGKILGLHRNQLSTKKIVKSLKKENINIAENQVEYIIKRYNKR